jgi:hypothetical protein
MQLDRTRIAIRERGLLETIDLSLHLIRLFAGPLIACALLAIVPLALINYFLVGWMMPTEIDVDSIGFRYFWNMTVLVFLESPLASVFIVAYLGPAVFIEERTLRQVAAASWRTYRLGSVSLDGPRLRQWLDRGLCDVRDLRLVHSGTCVSALRQRNHSAGAQSALVQVGDDDHRRPP